MLVSVSIAAVLSLVASPAVAGFWDNNKKQEEEDHKVKLTHHTAGSGEKNEPVEYGVDVVSVVFSKSAAAAHNNSIIP